MNILQKIYVFVFALLLLSFSIKAQSVKHYSKTGTLLGTYSKIADALALTVDGDSLLLSPHTFYESMIQMYATKYVILQGSISGIDTTTINSAGNGSCIYTFKGTIRDIILTGGAIYKTTDNTKYGGAIYAMEGKISGNTTIRNNSGFLHIVLIENSTIENNVKIINNSIVDTISNYSGTICIQNNAIIKDNVLISYNTGGRSGGIIVKGINTGDTGISKLKSSLTISGNVKIENNIGKKSGAIFSTNGARFINIISASIINNRVTTPGWGAAISADSGVAAGAGIPYDSVGVPYFKLSDVRVFNPLPDGTRQTEIRLCNRGNNSISKPLLFHSDACWWGDSDTIGLFQKDLGTYFSMPNYVVAAWGALPYGTSYSNVRAQMKLNTGAALPANSLKGLMGKFSSTAGSFSTPSSIIDPSNLISSDFYFPTSGSYILTASVDADTFRPTGKEMGIIEKGFEQVKIYPNPATDFINMVGVVSGSSIELYDMMGKLLKNEKVKMNNAVLDVKLLPAGVYHLKITNKEGHVGTARVAKE